MRWTAPGAAAQPQIWEGVTLTPVTGIGQTLISGPAVLQGTEGGWPGVVTGQTYRLALRRDRVLEVGGDACTPGWDRTQDAAFSDATGLYAVFDLEGPAAFDLLTRGTEVSLGVPSRSVARQLFGWDVLLYRRGAERFRLHIGPAHAEGLVHLLSRAQKERLKA